MIFIAYNLPSKLSLAFLSISLLLLFSISVAGGAAGEGRPGENLGTDRASGPGPVVSIETPDKALGSGNQPRTPVRLEMVTFDPAKKNLNFEEGWSHSYEGEQVGRYIVQFEGPVGSEEKTELENLGAEVISFIPDHSYLVKADPSSRPDIRSLSSVRWVGKYQPAYKVARGLLEENGWTGEVTISTFSSADTEQLISDLEKIGVDCGTPAKIPSGSMIRATADENDLSEIAQIESVRRVEGYSQPETMNNRARRVIQSGVQDYYAPVHDNGIRGENQVIAVADTGLLVDSQDEPSHEVFADSNDTVGTDHRKVLSYYVPEGAGGKIGDESGHGTHVAGSVGGDAPTQGVYDGWDGQAFQSKIEMQDIDNSNDNKIYPPADLTNLFQPAYENGARIHTNSWGGGPQEGYTSYSYIIDNYMWEHKDFQILFAMGNDGPSNWTLNEQAEAKNVISVGATWNGDGSENPYGFNTSAENMPDSSSRGPAEDGRIKPTIVAPGIAVRSSYTDNNTDYHPLAGTSMSAPTVAGGLALIRQYYTEGWYPNGGPGGGFEPSAALMRSTMLSGATEIMGENAYYSGGKYPNPDQGWGIMNLDKSLFFENNERKLLAVDESKGLGTGENWTYQVEVRDNSTPASFVLAWTDYPGDPSSSSMITNDLDLKITAPSGENYWGNNFASSKPNYSVSGGSPDDTNVEEMVKFIPDGNTYQEGIYTVTVSGAEVSMGEDPDGTQPFALVATGDVSLVSPSLQSPTDGDAAADDTPNFEWSAVAGADNYELQHSTDNTFTINTVTIRDIRNDNYQVSDSLEENTYHWRVRAGDDNGNTSGWSGAWSFTVDKSSPSLEITSPAQDEVVHSDNVNMTWSASDGGSGIKTIEVRLDGTGGWTELSESSADNYNFEGLSEGEHTAEVRATDRALNENTDSVGFKVDTYVLRSTDPGGSEVNTFYLVDNVYVTGDNLESGSTYYIIITDNAEWSGGEDLTSENVCPIVSVTADENGSFGPSLAWEGPLKGHYDLIADNGDSIYDNLEDGLDDMDVGGAGMFVVPETASIFVILACLGALFIVAGKRRK